jgi:hypothetical protein
LLNIKCSLENALFLISYSIQYGKKGYMEKKTKG